MYFLVQTCIWNVNVYKHCLEWNACQAFTVYSAACMCTCTHNQAKTHCTHIHLWSSCAHTQSDQPPLPPYCLLYIVKSYCRYYVAAPFTPVFSLSSGHYNLLRINTLVYCDGNSSLGQRIQNTQKSKDKEMTLILKSKINLHILSQLHSYRGISQQDGGLT